MSIKGKITFYYLTKNLKLIIYVDKKPLARSSVKKTTYVIKIHKKNIVTDPL